MFNSRVNELVLQSERGVSCFRLHLSKPPAKQMSNVINNSVVVDNAVRTHQTQCDGHAYLNNQ